MIVSVIFIDLTTIGSMVGKGGNIILGIDAGLPIGIEKQATVLGSLPSDQFKAETNFGDMGTKAFAGNKVNLFNDKEVLTRTLAPDRERKVSNLVLKGT
jgi:hypothetical protein